MPTDPAGEPRRPRTPPDLGKYHLEDNPLEALSPDELAALDRVNLWNVVDLQRQTDLTLLLLREKLRQEYRAARDEAASAPGEKAKEQANYRWNRYELLLKFIGHYRPHLSDRVLLSDEVSTYADATAAVEDAEDDDQVVQPAQTTAPVPPTSRERSDPSPLLFSRGYRGRVLGIPEWVRVAVPARIAARKAKQGDDSRGGAVGNLILVLSQLAYWSEPDGDGRPRAAERHRVQAADVWWLAVSAAALAKQTGLKSDHVRAALDRLVSLKLVERWVGNGMYGPNTAHLRVAWERVEPLIKKVMEPRRQRPAGGKSE